MKNTLIITGAGSNTIYGFPTGMQLRTGLIRSTTSLWDTYFSRSTDKNKFQIREKVIKEIETFTEKFKNSSFNSIDNFLNVNQELGPVGKFAIFLAICNAEMNSKFREELSNPSDDWLFWIFNKFMAPAIMSPHPGQALEQLNFRFITFNYDRTLEWFFSDSILNAIARDAAGEYVQTALPNLPFLDIIHMYGRLAPLPFQEVFNPFQPYLQRSAVLPFGILPNEPIGTFTGNIRLIGERLAAQTEKLAEVFAWAEHIFFLGFGFDDQNILALNLRNNLRPKHSIFATCYGLVDREIQDITNSMIRFGLPGEKVQMSTESILVTLRRHISL